MDGLQGADLTPEQIDDIYEKLANMGIEVVPEVSDLETLEPEHHEEEVEVDLSVPEGLT